MTDDYKIDWFWIRLGAINLMALLVALLKILYGQELLIRIIVETFTFIVLFNLFYVGYYFYKKHKKSTTS